MQSEGWSDLLNDIKQTEVSAQAKAPVLDKSLITIDESSSIPLWLQLRNRLTYLITSGIYPAGAQLPSVRELALDLNLNYNTVNKVFRDIERDGYVVTKRGRGTYVAEVNTEGAHDSNAAADLLVQRFFDDCSELGLSAQDAAALAAKKAGGLFV